MRLPSTLARRLPNKSTGLLSWLAALLLVLTCALFAQAALPVPELTGRVVDLTATLNPGQQAALEQHLRAFEERKGSQIAVLLVPDTEPEAIEQFALRVAEQWKLGRKKIDDGAILVIAKNARSLRIEVGYGLEGALNDATAKRIVDEIIVPRLKQQDFYGGIEQGVDAMMRVIDGEPLPVPEPTGLVADKSLGLLPVFFFAAVIVGGIMRSLFGRAKGALITAGLLGLAGWLLIGLLSVAILAALLGFVIAITAGRMGGGHYGGGDGRGGSWGGGGFRGGGGGFGGGGASGRW
jgi:uncharacterized protein